MKLSPFASTFAVLLVLGCSSGDTGTIDLALGGNRDQGSAGSQSSSSSEQSSNEDEPRTDRTCKEPCGGDSPVCIEGDCEECAVHSDCRINERCRPEKYSCVDACKEDTDCDDKRCHNEGYCVECIDNDDCNLNNGRLQEPTKYCDPSGECRDCTGGAECPPP